MFVPVPRISKEDLKQRLDGAEPPVVVDARLKYPYEHSTVRLPGAIRYAPDAQGEDKLFVGLRKILILSARVSAQSKDARR